VPGGEDCVDLAAKERKKHVDVEAVSQGCEGLQIFLREPKEPNRRVHAAAILRVGGARELLL
jgi:hypothetical protein